MPDDPASDYMRQRVARMRAAEAAARRSGALLLERAGKTKDVMTKSSSKDLVTEVDIASGKQAISELLAQFPDDGVLAEEPDSLEGIDSMPAEDARFVWVVDPLDGTTSYVHSYPYFSVSIALLERGEPVAGVVYAPIDDECFTGVTERGAWLNGEPLTVSDRRSIDEALLITGFPYDRTWPVERQIRILYGFLQRVHGIRRGGSAALDLCYVAAGRADAYWELEMKDWDLAAGAVILREAGGSLSGFDGSYWKPGIAEVVGSNGALEDQLRSVIANADPGKTPRDLPPIIERPD